MSTSPQTVASATAPTPVASSTDLKRRRFLLALGAGGAGATAVAATSLAVPIVASPVGEKTAEGLGYRETEHVRDYYATTRI